MRWTPRSTPGLARAICAASGKAGHGTIRLPQVAGPWRSACEGALVRGVAHADVVAVHDRDALVRAEAQSLREAGCHQASPPAVAGDRRPILPCPAMPRLDLAAAARAAGQAADLARGEILSRFRSVSVEQKLDGSPVTEADRAAERVIRAHLRAGLPGVRDRRRGVRRGGQPRGAALGDRPDRRDDRLLARHPALHDADRAGRGRRAAGRADRLPGARRALPRLARRRLPAQRRAHPRLAGDGPAPGDHLARRSVHLRPLRRARRPSSGWRASCRCCAATPTPSATPRCSPAASARWSISASTPGTWRRRACWFPRRAAAASCCRRAAARAASCSARRRWSSSCSAGCPVA